ncbi:hypothetical protein GCK32_005189 [Trichostrongylus colubriformis]|uniref:Uncharacterized protein n=1 Tax=Trichostrongylus colubriformis TaxID=6319 RepID=A0AAN8FS99_TRICO
MFVTGFHGEQLASWDEKSRLLNSWRRVADRYMERFNVTVFSEEGFFIDLLKVCCTF